jgi:flagellar basal-body rod modification protein FlgD
LHLLDAACAAGAAEAELARLDLAVRDDPLNIVCLVASVPSALSSNFGDFLQMLMTQLKNQDPTSPMDTNEFTSELVQFSGVEQQINTNSSLTQLIQLTQGGEVMQGAAMDGKAVTVQSSQIALQNGTGTLNFTTAAAEPVAIAITNSSGQAVYSTALTSTAGRNTWTWNGQDNNGNQLPDGAYNVAVATGNADGSTTACRSPSPGPPPAYKASAAACRSSSAACRWRSARCSRSGTDRPHNYVTHRG